MSGINWAKWAARAAVVGAVVAIGWQSWVAAKMRSEKAAEEARGRVIEQERMADADRSELNAQLQADLVAGRTSLRAAAERFLALYGDMPGAMSALDVRCPGRGRPEQAALHLVWRTAHEDVAEPAVIDRLKREFVEQFVLSAPERLTRAEPATPTDKPTLPAPMPALPPMGGKAATGANVLFSPGEEPRARVTQ